MKQGQCRNLPCTTVHLIGVFPESGLHLVDLFQRYLWFHGDDLHLHRCLDKGKTILWKTVVVLPDLGRGKLNAAEMLLLDTFYQLLLAYLLSQILTNASDAFAVVLLKTFDRTGGGNVLVDEIFELTVYGSLLYFNAVELSLIEKQLANSKLFGNKAIGITLNALVLHQYLFPVFFHLRFEDGFIAYHPYDLVN